MTPISLALSLGTKRFNILIYQLSFPDSLLDKSMTLFFHFKFISHLKSREKLTFAYRNTPPLFVCIHLDFQDGYK